MNDDLLLLRACDVEDLLSGRETDLLETVADAYRAHGAGQSSLPHSTFLRFPDDELSRIIALPAYLGDGFEISGVKWISSFPSNLSKGIERASAVMVVNSCETGRPMAILEGSIISARRTAASAAVAARELTRGLDPVREVGLIGAGPIGFEILRFLRQALPSIERAALFDLDLERARSQGVRVGETLGWETEVASSGDEVLGRCRLVAYATTAGVPHVHDLSMCPPGATILHVSLRDLAPELILAADNVVDDPDHVCRASTSVHLAEQESGKREFIRCTLADVLDGREPPRATPEGLVVFSPFGLGVLDLAVAHRILAVARERSVGTPVPSFFP